MHTHQTETAARAAAEIFGEHNVIIAAANGKFYLSREENFDPSITGDTFDIIFTGPGNLANPQPAEPPPPAPAAI